MRSEAEIREALDIFEFLLADTRHAASEAHVAIAQTFFDCLSWVAKDERGKAVEVLMERFRAEIARIESKARSQRQ